ncbi:ecdysone-induced protein 74EF-like [Cyclospora cayetanensis]|uniref:Ecdysone-induced protein 74EF-like n=1 Tax=Cyclospora cayetanensis TaxID=88456 RepID=A0A6P6RVH1_9EIME|nr:ecdysone-induced protein 74EF-like [Cyclospora cayetanensis]
MKAAPATANGATAAPLATTTTVEDFLSVLDFLNLLATFADNTSLSDCTRSTVLLGLLKQHPQLLLAAARSGLEPLFLVAFPQRREGFAVSESREAAATAATCTASVASWQTDAHMQLSQREHATVEPVIKEAFAETDFAAAASSEGAPECKTQLLRIQQQIDSRVHSHIRQHVVQHVLESASEAQKEQQQQQWQQQHDEILKKQLLDSVRACAAPLVQPPRKQNEAFSMPQQQPQSVSPREESAAAVNETAAGVTTPAPLAEPAALQTHTTLGQSLHATPRASLECKSSLESRYERLAVHEKLPAAATREVASAVQTHRPTAAAAEKSATQPPVQAEKILDGIRILQKQNAGREMPKPQEEKKQFGDVYTLQRLLAARLSSLRQPFPGSLSPLFSQSTLVVIGNGDRSSAANGRCADNDPALKFSQRQQEQEQQQQQQEQQKQEQQKQQDHLAPTSGPTHSKPQTAAASLLECAELLKSNLESERRDANGLSQTAAAAAGVALSSNQSNNGQSTGRTSLECAAETATSVASPDHSTSIAGLLERAAAILAATKPQKGLFTPPQAGGRAPCKSAPEQTAAVALISAAGGEPDVLQHAHHRPASATQRARTAKAVREAAAAASRDWLDLRGKRNSANGAEASAAAALARCNFAACHER